MNVEIVIPTFNDYESIKVLLEKIEKCASYEVSFLIVDNGSTDSRVWNRLNTPGKNWRAINTPNNLGFGGGVKFGLVDSKSPYIGWMPGNLKVDPKDVCELLKEATLHPEIFVKALRSERDFEFRFKTFLSSMMQTIYMRRWMRDTGGTPTIIHSSFRNIITLGPNSFVFESWSLWVAKNSKKEIKRPKVKYGNRRFGSSHWQRGLAAEVQLMINILRESRSWVNLISRSSR